MFAELEAELGWPLVAPDLPGHGSAAGVPATLDAAFGIVGAAVDEVAGLPVLLGYSMGGRIALRYALEQPGAVGALVLVSVSPGIPDPSTLVSRRREDAALADRIERIGIEAFIAEWLARPMFAGLARRGESWLEADRRLRRGNTAAGLAAALRGLGQGALGDVTPRLGELALPTLLVAGGADPAYRAHAEGMAGHLPQPAVAVVAGVGHAVVGEAPAQLAAAVRSFLEILDTEHTFG